jgi:hypothetical protein
MPPNKRLELTSAAKQGRITIVRPMITVERANIGATANAALAAQTQRR